MWPFDEIGSGIGNAIASVFDTTMTALWNAALDMLRAAFELVDHFSVFTVSTSNGPVRTLWPMMLWISGVLALSLFFWQLIVTNLRAGRGFIRLVGGPVQYGVALAVTVGLVATFLAGIDGLTNGILSYGLRSTNFTAAFSHTSIAAAAGHGIKAVVLGLCAIGGLFPAAIGYVLEMLFREAAIYVLVAVIPLVAAGLLADVTAGWFWRTTRWLAAAIAMKPVLALTLVLGVSIAGNSQGIAGLLAGLGVLEISLVAPFVLFRLFAFVDPRSDPGGGLRDFLSSRGLDSYGANSPASMIARATSGGQAAEQANVGRFEAALTEHSDESSCEESDSQAANQQDESAHTGASTDQDTTGAAGAQTSSPSANTADRDDGGEGEGPPPPTDFGGDQGGPQPDGGGGGPHDGGPGGGSGGGAAAGGAEEAAVIV
jgi:hypothetical protein